MRLALLTAAVITIVSFAVGEAVTNYIERKFRT